MNYKKLFKQCMREIFSNKKFDIKVIEKYFDKNYTQKVNQDILNYSDFVKHIQLLKKEIKECEFEFVNLICENNNLHSTHIIKATKKDGRKMKAKVSGFFTFLEDKIIYTDELTCLLEGHKEDSDLGSRH